jgi:hypothetical protein
MEKRRVVKAVIHGIENVTSESLKQDGSLLQLLISEVPKSIEYASKNRKIFATLFEINDSSTYVEIHKRDWVQALESCVKYYIDKENYEMCTKIKHLISVVKSTESKFIINDNKEREDE